VSSMVAVSDTTPLISEISDYDILSGYFAPFIGDEFGIIADEPRRWAMLILYFAEHDPTDPNVSSATVHFVGEEAGPVRSLGKVYGPESDIYLPRDEFPAFLHAIRDCHAGIQMRWRNFNGEVIEFLAHGSARLAPNAKESQRLVDSLRRKLPAHTGD
jgi:hypothetical protein